MKCKGLGFFPARVVRLLTWWLISRKKETEAVGIIKTGAQKSQNISSTTNCWPKQTEAGPDSRGGEMDSFLAAHTYGVQGTVGCPLWGQVITLI